jgi:hypothetical protein
MHPNWNERWRDEDFTLKQKQKLVMVNQNKKLVIEKYSHTFFGSMTVGNCVSMNSMFLVCEKHS